MVWLHTQALQYGKFKFKRDYGIYNMCIVKHIEADSNRLEHIACTVPGTGAHTCMHAHIYIHIYIYIYAETSFDGRTLAARSRKESAHISASTNYSILSHICAMRTPTRALGRRVLTHIRKHTHTDMLVPIQLLAARKTTTSTMTTRTPPTLGPGSYPCNYSDSHSQSYSYSYGSSYCYCHCYTVDAC